MKTLLVIAFIQVILHMTSADWDHPHYSYRCLENGGVELFGVHNGSSIIVDGKVNGTQCIYHYNTTKPSGVFAIQPQCLTNNFNATISVYDKVFDGISEPLTTITTASPKIIGGHVGHKFVITCEDIPETGINRTVAHVFQEKDYNKLPNNYKEVGAVEMRFKAVNDTAAPDISTVYIGDEFYMFIKYMGEQDYTVIPEECTAIGGTSITKGRKTDSRNSVKLWKRNSNNGTTCVQHDALLENFFRYNNTLIYAKMYGFRFSGKDFVTITCQVRIYDKKDPQNGNLCSKIPVTQRGTTTTRTPAPAIVTPTPSPSSAPTGRRKRDVENMSFQTKALAKKLWVYDNKNIHLAENISQKLKMEVSLWIVIFTLVTLR